MTYLAIEQALNDHWPKVELRRVARIRRETNSRSEETLLALSAYTGVRPRPEDGGNQLPSEETITGYWVARPGDLVLNPMWALEGGVAVSEYRGALSTAYRVYDLGPAIAPRFAHYYFRSRPAIEQYRLMVRGLTTFDRSVSREDFEGMPMPLPPFDVQQAIADYLDTETARIDALVSKKQRMVELLLELAKAKLMECFVQPVTNRSLRAMAEITLGRQRSPQHDSGPFMVRYLRAANVKDGRLALDDVKEMNFSPAEQGRFALKYGDVLVTEGAGSLEAVGASAVWRDDLHGTVCFQNTLLRLRPSSLVTADFLGWWCRYAYHARLFADLAGGANIYHLGANGLKTIRCHIPSIEDQGRIVTELEHLFGVNERVIAALGLQISLLGERRQALITAAVTGQLNIPEVAA